MIRFNSHVRPNLFFILTTITFQLEFHFLMIYTYTAYIELNNYSLNVNVYMSWLFLADASNVAQNYFYAFASRNRRLTKQNRSVVDRNRSLVDSQWPIYNYFFIVIWLDKANSSCYFEDVTKVTLHAFQFENDSVQSLTSWNDNNNNFCRRKTGRYNMIYFMTNTLIYQNQNMTNY